MSKAVQTHQGLKPYEVAVRWQHTNCMHALNPQGWRGLRREEWARKVFFQYRNLKLCQDVVFSSFCSIKDRPTPVISGSKESVDLQNKIYVDSSIERYRQSKNKIPLCDRKVRERNVASGTYVLVLTSTFRERKTDHHCCGAVFPVPILKLYKCFSFSWWRHSSIK